MNLKLSVICSLFLLIGQQAFGQAKADSILLLNGRVFFGEITSTSGELLQFKETDKKGNTLTTEIENYRIFSYTQDGVSTTVYEEDEYKDNFLTVGEARNATLGSYDARQTFKPHFVFWSSLALGYGATIYDTYLQQKSIEHPDYQGDFTSPGFFKSRPSLFPVFVPVVLSVGWSFPSFKVKKHQIIQKHLLNDESYYRGYHRVAKQKRMLSALKGSLIGIGTGLITYAIFKP